MTHAFRQLVPLLLCSAILLATSACGAPLITLTEKNDGDKVTLAKGAALQIRLKSNPTTGFSWTVAKNNRDVLRPKSDPVYEEADKSLPAAGGVQTATFTAEAAGTSELDLRYEGRLAVAGLPTLPDPGRRGKKFTVTVTVE